jgi:hypothetical protein
MHAYSRSTDEVNIMDIFRFQSSAFPDSTKLVGFRGREALSELFRFEIFVTVPSDEEINEEESVWLRASLIINRGGDDHAIHGMIDGIELLLDSNGRALFRVDLVPHLAALEHSFRSYVWTKQSIKDILSEVLSDALSDELELRLSGKYATEEHVCQYKETHFQFVSRWMEREGIYYFFDHSGDTDKLVLIDDPSRHDTTPHDAHSLLSRLVVGCHEKRRLSHALVSTGPLVRPKFPWPITTMPNPSSTWAVNRMSNSDSKVKYGITAGGFSRLRKASGLPKSVPKSKRRWRFCIAARGAFFNSGRVIDLKCRNIPFLG